jgi:hypothetical protein
MNHRKNRLRNYLQTLLLVLAYREMTCLEKLMKSLDKRRRDFVSGHSLVLKKVLLFVGY